MPILDPIRLMPGDPCTRDHALELYGEIASAPILSPHGHTDPSWFAGNARFPNPAESMVIPDHYVFRMLHSQGVSMDRLGVLRKDGRPVETDPRAIWQLLAESYFLFRATPSAMWIDYSLQEVVFPHRSGPPTGIACPALSCSPLSDHPAGGHVASN